MCRAKEWVKTGDILDDEEYYEMTNIKYKFNSKGQILLESKEDMKKRGLPSSDVFDSLCLTFAKGSSQIINTEQTGSPIQKYYDEIGF